MTFEGDILNNGISYVDGKGVTRIFTLELNVYRHTGSLVLTGKEAVPIPLLQERPMEAAVGSFRLPVWQIL